MNATDRALLVGIWRYPNFRDLDGPANDVKMFKEWLTNPSEGAVPAENVTTVTSSDFPQPQRPVLEDVHRFFANLLHEQIQSGSARLGRRLYIFLSGHGFAASTLSQAALCMADSDAKITMFPHLGGQVYVDNVGNRGMFDEIFLWMDCCRQTINAMPINLPPWPPSQKPVPPRRFFWGFATATGQLAAEAVMHVNGVQQTHGVFSALLMEGLQKCKTRFGGQVCASDLASYIFNRMKEVLGPQAPNPHFQSDPVQDIVLFNRTSGLTQVTIQAPGTTDDQQLRVSTGQDEDALQNPLTLTQGVATAGLEAGVYKVAILGTNRFALFAVPGNTHVTIP